MLTREKLVELYTKLRDQNVLSVYVDGGQTDPAERRVWLKVVENDFDRERDRLKDESPTDLDAFEAARDLVEQELRRFPAFLPDAGWVGFATADGLHYGEGVAVSMPNLVRFERGIRAAPYVRALKQDRVVVAAVADSRKARVFTYRDGEIQEVVDLIADRDYGDLADSVSSKRAGRFSGARGATGTDTERRLTDISAARMQSHLLDEIEKLAGSDGFVVFGGTSEVEAALARQAGRFGDRWCVRPPMHLGISETEAKAQMQDAASELTRRMQSTLLDQVVDAARGGGKGCLGGEATRKALVEGRVDTLLLSRSFRDGQPDVADHFVGSAFEQSAAVEELSGSEAERLDAEGEGVGARLRYVA